MCPLKKRVVVFNNDDLNNDILSTEAATQRIYIQKPAGTASVPKKDDAWVDNTGNSVTGTAPDAASGQTPVWTTKYPAYQKNYPLIYTALQRKDKKTPPTISCTTPIRDESMTVIDGGTIITGSIMANRLDVYDATIQKIRASAIDTDSIVIGQNQVSGLSTALDGKQPAGYITKIDNNGIKIHADNNTSTNYSRINADGLSVYKGGNLVSSFGDTATIGKTGTNDFNTYVDTTGVHLRKATTDLATIGSSGISFNPDTPFTIGNTSGSYIRWYKNSSNVWSVDINAGNISMGSDPVAKLSDLADNYVYELTPSESAIVKDKDGDYSSPTIVFTATRDNNSYSGRILIRWYDGTTWTTVNSMSTTDRSSYTYTIPAGAVSVVGYLYPAGTTPTYGATTPLDYQSVPIISDGDGTDGTTFTPTVDTSGNISWTNDGGKTNPTTRNIKGNPGEPGDDAYTIVLSNEAHTFAANNSAAIASSTTCSIIAYKGTDRIAATIGTITGQVTGLTTSISNNGTISASFTVSVTTSLTTTQGTLTIPLTVDGKSFTRTFSWSLSRKGDRGDEGPSSTYMDFYDGTYASAEQGLFIHSDAKGTLPSAGSGVQITSDGLNIRKTGNSVASFGESSARIGKSNSSRFEMGAGSLSAYNSSNNKYFEVTENGIFWGNNSAASNADLTTEINQRKASYATSTTGASTQIKTASCANFALYSGATIVVGFTNNNTHQTPSLNVNSAGNKAIKNYKGEALVAAEYNWAAGAALTFVYDGTNWRMQDSGATEAKASAAASATAASGYASNASGYASDADAAKTAAISAKNDASGYASDADAAKTAAVNAKNDASGSATAAANSASAASGSATAAESARDIAIDTVTVKDTRSTNQNPSWYITNYPKKRVQEFKQTSTIGLSGDTYCWLQTDVPWTDSSGGYPKQTVEVNGKFFTRQGTSNTAWSEWKDLAGIAENYILQQNDGIHVHNANDSRNYVLIGSSGMDVYKSISNVSTKVASFGSDILIGRTDTVVIDGVSVPQKNVYIDTAGVRLREATTDLAVFASDYTSLGGGAAKLKYSTDSVFSSDSHRVVLSKATHEPDIRNDATLSSRDIATFTDTTPMAFVNASHYVNTAGTEKTAEAGIYAWRGRSILSSPPALMRVDADVVNNTTYANIIADDIVISSTKSNGTLSIMGSDWDDVLTDVSKGTAALASVIDLSESYDSYVDSIGTIVTSSGTKSLTPGNTYKTTSVSVSLSIGQWVVTYSVAFPSNNTGQRASVLYMGNSNIAVSEMEMYSGANAKRITNGTAIVDIQSDNTSVTVYAWQTNTDDSNLTVTANISAVKVGAK